MREQGVRRALQRIKIEDITGQPGHDDLPVHQGPAPIVEEPEDALIVAPERAERDGTETRTGGPTVEELPDEPESNTSTALVPYRGGGAMATIGGAQGQAQEVRPEQVDAILDRLAGLPAYESLLARVGLASIRAHVAMQLGRMGAGGGPRAVAALLSQVPRLLGGPAPVLGAELPPGLRPASGRPRLAMPNAPLYRGLPQNPVEQRIAQIHVLGRPAHRTPHEVLVLASQFQALPAFDLHALLSLPPGRSLSNLRYLVTGRPAHRPLAFVVGLAGAHPGVSVQNLVALARLPAARDGALAALINGAPRQVSLQSMAALALALPARTAADLIALAGLVPQRSLADLTLLGGAPAHWTGQDIAQFARNCPAVLTATLVAMCQLPAARGVLGLTQFCQAVTPARAAADLVHLATVCPDLPASRLAPVAELPGVTGLPTPQLRATAIALDRHDDLFTTAAQAHAALATPLLAFSSQQLRQLIEARHPGTRAQLMTILAWAHYANFQNCRDIVAHPKVDTVARLLAWLANPLVNDGNRLLTILQHPKIGAAPDVDYLLARNYTLAQIGSWLGQAWATRAGAAKTAVNGVIPLASVSGTGTTAGQRYSPDQNTVWPGHVCHLSMSFAIEGPLANRRARYTGFHVSWRLAGAPDHPTDPRMWFNVAGGQVTPNGFAGTPLPPVHAVALAGQANTLMDSYLTRTNCHR